MYEPLSVLSSLAKHDDGGAEQRKNLCLTIVSIEEFHVSESLPLAKD
jgi:hypothetical protein